MLSATSRSDAVRASMILNHYVNNPTLRDDVLHVKTPPLSTRMRVHVRVQKAQPRQKTHWYKTLGLQPGVPGLRPDCDFGTHCHETSGTERNAGTSRQSRNATSNQHSWNRRSQTQNPIQHVASQTTSPAKNYISTTGSLILVTKGRIPATQTRHHRTQNLMGVEWLVGRKIHTERRP